MASLGFPYQQLAAGRAGVARSFGGHPGFRSQTPPFGYCLHDDFLAHLDGKLVYQAAGEFIALVAALQALFRRAISYAAGLAKEKSLFRQAPVAH
jgi:hypothetical protein